VHEHEQGERQWGGGERESEAGSMLSEEPDVGLHPMTMRSSTEPTPGVSRLIV